jgi:hypothetical protein
MRHNPSAIRGLTDAGVGGNVVDRVQVAGYFKDNDKAPEHYDLGMYGSIKGVPATQ